MSGEARFDSIAAVIIYIDRHRGHFGFPPAAIIGTNELRAQIKERVMWIKPYNDTVPLEPDTLAGVKILWEEEE